MRVERSTLDQVKKRFEVNKKKMEEKQKDYDFEERMKELREEVRLFSILCPPALNFMLLIMRRLSSSSTPPLRGQLYPESLCIGGNNKYFLRDSQDLKDMVINLSFFPRLWAYLFFFKLQEGLNSPSPQEAHRTWLTGSEFSFLHLLAMTFGQVI